ncbi:MAG: ATP-dependent DNA helicase RecG [Candidatus Pacebacteria bacterium]|nr:ATP-dependent DNA helicase RecG [Candidatus Paceibacterota bacterium]MCF7857468.1 ATP-dependent DNA helicase RecG [Candidatus Paceibacterota bacterium]
MNLTDLLTQHFRVDTIHQKALARLGVLTIGDLLHHLPQRYEDISTIQSVQGLVKGQDAIVFGKIGGLKTRKAWKSRVPIAEGWIEDGSARIKIMWFNQPYLAKMLTDGMYVKLAGKVTGSEGKLYIANPEIEKLESLPIDRHDSIFNNTENLDETIYPVYKETKGVTSKWFYHTVLKCFEQGILEDIVDPIPEEILTRYHLPTLATALQWIHTPKKADHAKSARKRFAFEEVFYIQTTKALERAKISAATSYQFKTEAPHIKKFTERFPFSLTSAQKKSIAAIFGDFNGTHPMSRLLEGDVGSGKTAVAATAAYATVTSRPPEGSSVSGKLSKGALEFGNLQVGYMAPTEILAKQHFESFIEYFQHLPIQIGLITGSGCMKFPSKSNPTKPTKISKAQLLKWVKNGEVPIVIGTHALMYKSVEFKHLALVIIDEQHRFGTNQRKALAKKDARMPHLLSMTATPIPRTLALTVYGDLDITLLDEMPKGRKPIITKIITKDKQEEMYAHVRSELESGRQAYVICPRIAEPDPEKETALNVKSVIEEAKRLKEKVFKDKRFGILHSKMKPAEKEKIMHDFSLHTIDILVATSVVEVGVNVPNATNIIIEGAERFGLAQLHQLRGRVIRGTHQSYCFVVSDSKSEKTRDRLKALTTAKNGFELAEHDLTFRGSGELYGAKQSGLTDLGMEAIKNIKMVEAARTEAQLLVKNDPNLDKHPIIYQKVSKLMTTLHME